MCNNDSSIRRKYKKDNNEIEKTKNEIRRIRTKIEAEAETEEDI